MGGTETAGAHRPELVATNATTRPPCSAFVPPSRPWKTLESGGFFSLTPPEPWQIRAANKIGRSRQSPGRHGGISSDSALEQARFEPAVPPMAAVGKN